MSLRTRLHLKAALEQAQTVSVEEEEVKLDDEQDVKEDAVESEEETSVDEVTESDEVVADADDAETATVDSEPETDAEVVTDVDAEVDDLPEAVGDVAEAEAEAIADDVEVAEVEEVTVDEISDVEGEVTEEVVEETSTDEAVTEETEDGEVVAVDGDELEAPTDLSVDEVVAADDDTVDMPEAEVTTDEVVDETPEETTDEVLESEPEVTGDETESEELIDEVAEELLEVNDAAEEVDDLDDQVDEMEEAAEGLESIAIAMEATLKIGGMSAETAAFANIATESYMNRLGISDVMPSLESFGGSGSRMLQTQVSIESVGEKVAQVWKAIAEFLKKIASAGKQFVKAMVSRKERIKQRVAALREKVKSADFKSGDLELSQKDLAGLSVGGRVSTNVAKDLSDFEKAFSEVANSRINSFESSVSLLNEVANDIPANISKDPEAITEALSASMGKALDDMASGLKSLNYSFMQKASGGDVPDGLNASAGAGMEVTASPEMIGNFRIFAAIGNDKESVLNSSIAVVGSDGVDGTARALTKAQAEAVLDSCDKVLESIEAADRNYSKAMDNVLKVSNGVERVITKIGSLASEKMKAVRPFGNQFRKASKVISNFGREPAEGMIRRSMTIMGSSLKLVAASAGETVQETENLPATA